MLNLAYQWRSFPNYYMDNFILLFFKINLLFQGYTSWRLPSYLHKRLHIIEAAMALIANKLITSNVVKFVTLTLIIYFHLQ